MDGQWRRGLVGVTFALVAAVAAAGCSNGSTSPSEVASQAASVGARATAAASSLASQASSAASRASEAIASATASANAKLNEIKGGVDARSAVRLATPTRESDGRMSVKVTAENTTDAAKSFAVQVSFTDSSGNLLDTTVLTIADVPAKGTKDGVAHSNRDLSGSVRTEVKKAVRY
ncbi:hypothetical protein ACFVIM_32420 [Streptomyces sp. NPDC057638]|uniref:hypothetical protein n=1 Tax=Streptomyces sp. NPDC057638 TaxID=3346190 RepID=UPI0036AD4311